MNKHTKSRKRLALDVETVRVLASEEVAIVGGGLGGGDEPAAIKLSVTVSWGGGCNCCRGGGPAV